MTSKKKLSDVLREEVNRRPPANMADTTIADKTAAQNEVPSTTESSSSRSKTKTSNVTSTRQSSQKTATSPATTTRKQSTSSSSRRITKAELEAQVRQLTQELDAAVSEKEILQAQIRQLQSTLEQQNQSLTTAKDTASQVETLKQELAQIKKEALALAEENQQLQNQRLQGRVKQPPAASPIPRKMPERKPSRQPTRRTPNPNPAVFERPILPAHSTRKSAKNFDTWCYD